MINLQLCGVRGGGNAAAQALFWQVKKGLSFTLAFQSERERNAAMMLARRFAFDCNVSITSRYCFLASFFFPFLIDRGSLYDVGLPSLNTPVPQNPYE